MELKTNTAVRIPVGPLVDPTDGKTAETALTVAGLYVQIYRTKTDGSAVVRVDGFNPTASGGSNDMALVTSSTDGMYDLELTAAQLNYYGNSRLSIYDVDGILVWWVDILVVSASYFNNKFGTTNFATPADVNTQVSDVLKTDTVAEMAQGAPPAAPTMEQVLNYLYRLFRNENQTTATETAIMNDAGTSKLVKATLSDNGTTFKKEEYGTGA